MERILCRRCMILKRLYMMSSTGGSTIQQRLPSLLSRDNPQVAGPKHLGGIRFYAVKDRSSEKKYKHGKLVEQKTEDPTIYPNFLMIFSSTDESVLDGYIHFVKKAAKMVDVNLTKSFNMPALEETYKAKREGKGLVSEIQYNFKQYQRVVELEDLTGDKSDIFMEYIQKAMPAGMKVEIQLKQWERYVDPNHIMFRDS